MLEDWEHVRQIAASRCAALSAALERTGAPDFDGAAPEGGSVAHHLYLSIVSQQLSVKAADTIWRRIVAVAAERSLAPADLFVQGCEPVLRACGVSGNKARSLTAVREADLLGSLDRARLAMLPPEARAKELCRIRGIGPWTADMLAIFHFRDRDVWPDGDVAARGMLVRLTGCEDSKAEAAHYAPVRSMLARCLWRIRDVTPLPRDG